MHKIITALFDGQVLHPDVPLTLEPNKHYRIIIEALPGPITTVDAWELLDTLTGTIEAPADWSSEHDHYLYGTPKHEPQ